MVRALYGLLLALVSFGASPAAAATAEEFVKIFEAARSKLPCVADVSGVASAHGLRKTAGGESREGYELEEYANPDKTLFLLASSENRDGVRQTAVSVSQYGTDDDFPPDVEIAFSDIWRLPQATPNRSTPDVVDFEWNVKFPNGKMRILISYSETGLTQIYGLMTNLSVEQLNECSKSP